MPIGQEGELLVRGPQVMKGYWNALPSRQRFSPMAGSIPATSRESMRTATARCSAESCGIGNVRPCAAARASSPTDMAGDPWTQV